MLKSKTAYLILAFACLLVYANSLVNGFVSDDIPAILKNQRINQVLSFWNEPQSFINSLINSFFGPNPFYYHLANLALHLVNTILVFVLLGKFFNNQASLIGALLFAVHPAHTEAVAWISGRGYLILTFFLLSVYLLYYQACYREKSRPLFYFLALWMFSYYMLNNFTFAALLPAFIIFSDIVFGRWRENWKLWLAFILIVVLRLSFSGGLFSERISYVGNYLSAEPGTVSWRDPFLPFVYSVFAHLRILFFPLKLTFYYEPIIFKPLAISAGIIILAALACFLPLLYRKSKIVFLGIGMFIIFLSPTYSPLPIAAPVAERYLYFPSIFLSILAAFLYQEFSWNKNDISRKRSIVFFMLLAGLFAMRTIIRNVDWKDSQSLFAATIKASPESPSGHNGMGAVYFHQGDIDRAISEFSRAIELKKNYAMAYCNRGVAYYNKKDLNKAISDFDSAIRLKADYPEAYSSRAIAYFSAAEYNKSWEDACRLKNLKYQLDPRFLSDLAAAIRKNDPPARR